MHEFRPGDVPRLAISALCVCVCAKRSSCYWRWPIIPAGRYGEARGQLMGQDSGVFARCVGLVEPTTGQPRDVGGRAGRGRVAPRHGKTIKKRTENKSCGRYLPTYLPRTQGRMDTCMRLFVMVGSSVWCCPCCCLTHYSFFFPPVVPWSLSSKPGQASLTRQTCHACMYARIRGYCRGS